jgi:hypothetical protein
MSIRAQLSPGLIPGRWITYPTLVMLDSLLVISRMRRDTAMGSVPVRQKANLRLSSKDRFQELPW